MYGLDAYIGAYLSQQHKEMNLTWVECYIFCRSELRRDVITVLDKCEISADSAQVQGRGKGGLFYGESNKWSTPWKKVPEIPFVPRVMFYTVIDNKTFDVMTDMMSKEIGTATTVHIFSCEIKDMVDIDNNRPADRKYTVKGRV